MRVSIPLAKVALRWGVRRLSIHHPRLLKRWLADQGYNAGIVQTEYGDEVEEHVAEDAP